MKKKKKETKTIVATINGDREASECATNQENSHRSDKIGREMLDTAGDVAVAALC